MDTINLLLFSSYAFLWHAMENNLYIYLHPGQSRCLSLNSCMLTRGFIPNPPISSSKKDIKFQEVI